MSEFSGKPQDIKEQVVESIPKQYQEAFARVVKAGNKVMYSEQTHDLMMEQLSQDGDPSQVIGEGIAGMMLLLYQKSNQSMPTEVIVPAGVYLLADGVEFLEVILEEPFPPETTASAVEVMLSVLMEKFGIDKEKFNMAMEKSAAGGYD